MSATAITVDADEKIEVHNVNYLNNFVGIINGKHEWVKHRGWVFALYIRLIDFLIILLLRLLVGYTSVHCSTACTVRQAWFCFRIKGYPNEDPKGNLGQPKQHNL